MTPTKSRGKPRKRATRRVDAALTETAASGKLNDAIKTDVVQRLAMYDSPKTIADAVKEEYGIEISRQGIQAYDPTVGTKPADRWCAIFKATRKKFLETTADIPIANRSVRLRRLERMAIAAEGMRNFALAAALHEQAAKEVGDVYTNRSKVAITDPNGAPFRVIIEEDSRGPAGGQG